MNRRWTYCLATLLAAFLFSSGCSQTKTVAAAPAARAVTAGLDPNDFKPIWLNTLPLDKGDLVTRVYVNQDLVLAVTSNNVVYVVGKADGVLKYFTYVNGGGQEIGTPVVMPDRIVYPAQSSLEVYNRRTGDFIRSIPLGFTISSGAVAQQDDLYMGADLGGGELADVDLTRDYVPLRWQLLVFGAVRGTPALYQNIIYVGSGDGSVRAVTPDRTGMWPLEHDAFFTGGEITGDIKADDGGVYAASTSGRLVCLDRNTGKLKWQYFSPNPLKVGPVLTRTSIYQQVPELGLAAIDKTKLVSVDDEGKHKVEEFDRIPRWISADAAQVVTEDRLFTFVRSADNQLLALDRLTGAVHFNGGGVHFTAIATDLTDDAIYGVNADGSLVALKPILQPGSPGYLQ